MSDVDKEIDPEVQADWDAGVAAAKESLAASDGPIMMMDEMPGISMDPDVKAMGWNSVWASEENRTRWVNVREKSAN
jgi:hypothetical protein